MCRAPAREIEPVTAREQREFPIDHSACPLTLRPQRRPTAWQGSLASSMTSPVRPCSIRSRVRHPAKLDKGRKEVACWRTQGSGRPATS